MTAMSQTTKEARSKPGFFLTNVFFPIGGIRHSG